MSQTILISGATGVLGNLVAKTFAERGYNLALLAKDQNKLDVLTRELNLPANRFYAQSIDLLEADALSALPQTLFAKFDTLNALVHLVGGWVGGKPLPDSESSDLESMLNQHVWTTFNLIKTFTPQLVKNKSSRVIIISQPTTIKPTAKSGIYAAAKSAQESLIFTLAEEYKEQGLTANIIHVKSIDINSAGKGTTPAEIVSAMLYLFSEEANKVNGARIPLYK